METALVVAVACEKAAPPTEPAVVRASADAQLAPPPPSKLALHDTAHPAPPLPPAVYTYLEQMPELPGHRGTAAIVENIQRHLIYPQVPAAEQHAGRVFASFVVTDKGEVQAAEIIKGLSAAYDEAVLKAIQQLPRFVPGKKDGKAVNVSFTVPILFATAPLPSGENAKIISH